MGMDINLFHTLEFFATANNWYIEAWDITSTPQSNPDATWFINDGEDFPLLMWQYTEETGIKENITTHEITVYPNPTTGELRIKLTSEQINKIEVFDIYGRHLSPLTSHLSPHTSINISDLPAGIYFVKIYTESEVVVKKVIKQ